ncbi:hypothetical protein BDZ97DRAFT_1757852 [Flammula alnicola]|nr:hypothetical protein BDZ97DRAFT_1757852 [Flammula alnicola]
MQLIESSRYRLPDLHFLTWLAREFVIVVCMSYAMVTIVLYLLFITPMSELVSPFVVVPVICLCTGVVFSLAGLFWALRRWIFPPCTSQDTSEKARANSRRDRSRRNINDAGPGPYGSRPASSDASLHIRLDRYVELEKRRFDQESRCLTMSSEARCLCSKNDATVAILEVTFIVEWGWFAFYELVVPHVNIFLD